MLKNCRHGVLHARRAATEAEPGPVRVRQLDLCINPSSLKDMGRLGNDCRQADLGTWI